MDAPGLVECGEYVTSNNLVADEAKITEQLMVVRFAVRQSAFLIVTMTQKRFLAFGTDEVLNVPMLSESGYHTFFDGASTGTANWDSHTVVAPKAVQLIHVVGSVASAIFHFACGGIQLLSTSGTVEMVPVVNFTPEAQRSIVYYAMALVADVLAQSHLFLLAVAVMAEGTVLVANESGIGQRNVAPLAGEALRVPVGRHRLDDTSDDKVVALVATRRE